MNKLYVRNFKEGMRVDENLLVVGVTKGLTNAGSTYLNVELQDNSGVVDAKLWDASQQDIDEVVAGSVLRVNGDVLLYRGNIQIRINSVIKIDEMLYDISDFLKASPISKEELQENVYSFLEQIENEILYNLTNKIIRDNEKDFFTYPAASRIHHEYVGGLATHVLGMLRIAESLVSQHSFINKSLLYSGIILHDFGKVTELSGPILTHYTTEGKLLGHISMMQADLLGYAKELNVEDSEEVMLLRHLILSHHGQYEFGSPVLPMVTEAELLSFIDNVDARINMLDKAMSQVEEGEFSTRIFSLENRSFYKSKI